MKIILFSGYKPFATVSYFYKYLKRKEPDTVFVSYDEGTDYFLSSHILNLKKIFKEIFEPDLFLYVETDPGKGFFIEDLLDVKVKKAVWLIDSHLNYRWHKNFAKLFDYVFVAQKSLIPWFKKYGINPNWLPLACDPEIHKEWFKIKEYDIVFIGHLNKEREKFFKEMENNLKGIKILVKEKIYLEEMAKIQSKGKIGFNLPVRKDINMRTFEVPACGSLLFSPFIKHINEIYNENEVVIYKNKDEIYKKIEYFLERDEKREEMKEKAKNVVINKHNYLERVNNFLFKIKKEEDIKKKSYFDFFYLTFNRNFKKYRKFYYLLKILNLNKLFKNLSLELEERIRKKLNKFPY
ncbi:MAG: glycosyltransferase [Candidatus Hydrothermales bacterium]